MKVGAACGPCRAASCPWMTHTYSTFVVSGYEAQYVVVAEHDGLVDLSLAEPRALLSGREDLHGHVAAPPAAPPHLSETPLPDDLLQDDGPGHGPLDEQRQT